MSSLIFFQQDGKDSPDSTGVGDLGECLLPISSADGSTNPDSYLCEMEKTPFNTVQSWLKHEGTKGEDSSHHFPGLLRVWVGAAHLPFSCLPPARNGGNLMWGCTNRELAFSLPVLRNGVRSISFFNWYILYPPSDLPVCPLRPGSSGTAIGNTQQVCPFLKCPCSTPECSLTSCGPQVS